MSRNEEARWHQDWAGNHAISYPQWLQNREYERSVRFEIDTQASRLIASNEQLSREGVSRISGVTQAGFSEVSKGLKDLGDGMARQSEELLGGLSAIEISIEESTKEICSTLYWGFDGLLDQLSILENTLEELVRIAKTPSQVWAFEQFDIARDEYRKALFPEALESVTRAVNGYGTFTGFRSDFRFHALLGELRLGNYRNNSAEVVDPAAAQEAFVNAARYASASDELTPAGHALIAAGRAAFIQGDLTGAQKYTRQGLQHCSDDVQGNYQMARLCGLLGERRGAIEYFAKTFVLQPTLAIGAMGEAEFQGGDSDILPEAVALATTELTRRAIGRLAVLDTVVAGIHALPDYGTAISTFRQSVIEDVLTKRTEAVVELETKTLLGADEGIKKTQNAIAQAYRAHEEVLRRIMAEIDDQISNLNIDLGQDQRLLERKSSEISGFRSAHHKVTGDGILGYAILCFPVFAILFTMSTLSSCSKMNDGGKQIVTFLTYPIGLIFMGVLALGAGAAIQAVRRGYMSTKYGAKADASEATAKSARGTMATREARRDELASIRTNLNAQISDKAWLRLAPEAV